MVVVVAVDVTVLVASVDVIFDSVSGSATVLLMGNDLSSQLWYCIFEQQESRRERTISLLITITATTIATTSTSPTWYVAYMVRNLLEYKLQSTSFSAGNMELRCFSDAPHIGEYSTIRDLLVHPKDKDTILQKSGVIYRYSCGRVDCEDEYIGESDRTFGERFREHMRAPSPIIDHHNITGHEVSLVSLTISALWAREDNSIARNIKEAIFIRVNDPSLNRNIGQVPAATHLG